MSKIKIWLGIAVTAIMGLLAAMVAVSRSQRDTAIAERDKEAVQKDAVIDTNQGNEKVREVERDIRKAEDAVRHTSDINIDARLHKYDRSRNPN